MHIESMEKWMKIIPLKKKIARINSEITLQPPSFVIKLLNGFANHCQWQNVLYDTNKDFFSWSNYILVVNPYLSTFILVYLGCPFFWLLSYFRNFNKIFKNIRFPWQLLRMMLFGLWLLQYTLTLKCLS